ncbi:MAG: nuclear transport factor 2 family protein [Caulobacteraceae bacterium]|nr:nuclear transport factor 2 family protein [Caulobacteraceae bacterium]
MSANDDVAAIQRLITDYCYYTDTSDVDRLCGLFTDDFAFTGVFGDHHGHAGMRKLHEGRWGQPQPHRHLTFNTAIDVDGDEARARSYIVLLAPSTDGMTAKFAGGYADRFVKRGGRWLFKSRHIHAHPSEAAV